MTLVNLIQKIHRSREGDTVQDSTSKYRLMTPVESDYEQSKYVSFHDVVLQVAHSETYLKMSWEVTQEDDPEIVEDSVSVKKVLPRTTSRTVWEDA